MKAPFYKLIIADDQTFFMDALKIVIEQNKDFKVVATCDNLQQLIEHTVHCYFDLLILDVNFNGIKSIDYIDLIKKSKQDFLIVCLSSYQQSYIKEEAFKNGVDYFYNKNDSLDQFAKILLELLEEKRIVKKQEKIIEANNFTSRELDVLSALYEFTSDHDAAEHLEISLNTFKTHKQNLYKKSDSINNIQLIKYALQNGLIII